MRHLARALQSRGHDITVYASDAGAVNGNYQLFKTRCTVMKSIRITPSMLMASFRGYDLIHLHNYYTFQNTVSRLRHGSTPIILQPHGSFVIYDGLIPSKTRVLKLVDPCWRRWFLRNINCVICVSDIESRQAARLNLKTVKIPNGIDMKEFADLPAQGIFREKYKIPSDVKLVLSLGRDHWIKGLDLLRNAFKDIDDPNARLVIVGQQQERRAGNILELPSLYGRDKLEAYVDANLFVLPSRYEVFGITPLEAMACGTKVLVSEHCGIREYLEEGSIYHGDLAPALKRTINSEDSLAQCEARREFARQFDWDIITERLEKVYREI